MTLIENSPCDTFRIFLLPLCIASRNATKDLSLTSKFSILRKLSDPIKINALLDRTLRSVLYRSEILLSIQSPRNVSCKSVPNCISKRHEFAIDPPVTTYEVSINRDVPGRRCTSQTGKIHLQRYEVFFVIPCLYIKCVL